MAISGGKPDAAVLEKCYKSNPLKILDLEDPGP
jgi:hypothetical protein